MKRLERWEILGAGLVSKIIVTDKPLTPLEILHIVKTDSAVVTIYDAISDELLGMAYANKKLKALEEVRYYDAYTCD